MLTLFPSWWQQELLNSKARVKIAACGRRSGKTTGGLINLNNEFLKNPQLKAWYVALTYTSAKTRMWKPLIEGANGKPPMFPKSLIKQKSISELYIELKTGAQIWLIGGDNIDAVLGEGLDYLHIDEFQSQKKDNWSLLSPTLADRRGRAYLSGTSRGFNHFYDVWWQGWHENPLKAKNYQSWQIKTIDAGTVSEEEIEEQKAIMSPQMFAQEFEASFQNLAGRVYYNFDSLNREAGGSIDDKIEDDGKCTLLIGMDFNVNPMTATINRKVKGELWTIEEIYLENSNTPQMIKNIKDKYKDRNIIVYPDPSGGSRKTSAQLNSTDHTMLRAAGFTVKAKPKAPFVTDRVNEVNSVLLNALEVRRWFIHPRCQRLIKCLLGLTYLDNGDIDKTSGLDHLPDGVGYLIDLEYPINPVGSMGSYSM